METILNSIIEGFANTLGYADLTIWQGGLLAFLGFVLFWALKVQAAKKKRKAEAATFVFLLWWENNFWDLAISFIAAIGVFYASHWSNHLTVGACLAIGISVSTLTNVLKKVIV